MQFSVRKLFVFAHKAEARLFLQNAAYRKEREAAYTLYRSAQGDILITGEGKENVRTRLGALLADAGNHYGAIINLGVGGALDQNLEIGRLYAVNRVSYRDREPVHCAILGDRSPVLRCRTLDKPLVSENNANPASGLTEDIVDMEAYHIARIAQKAGMKFHCLKLVSDYAGKTEAGEIIALKRQWGEQIFSRFAELLH